MKEAAVVLLIRDTDVPAIPVDSRLVVGYQREILAVSSRKFTTMVLPGGTVDPGEIPLHTAIRELREEISVEVEPRSLIYINSNVSRVEGQEDWLVHLFYARVVWGKPTHVENGTELRWLSYEKFLESTIFSTYYRMTLPEGIVRFASTHFHGV